ncbi:MAG: outer membrane protein assembly factor BamA [Deltaproteobacteria bacterium]|nr:MAG: outer membrane protein assembly factor BamA [Deltaproteobacteria bacterium]
MHGSVQDPRMMRARGGGAGATASDALTAAAWARRGLVSLALLMVLLLAPGAFAQGGSGIVIEEIEVRGAERVEPEAVRRAARLRAGDEIDDRAISEAIRGVDSLGFFSDVVVRARPGEAGVVLLFEVVEKPSIRSIVIEGNSRVSDDDILEAIPLREDAILDESLIRQSVRRIEDLYREKGYYLARVESQLIRVDQTTVTVRFDIQEAQRVRIARVSFVGNDSIPDQELLRFMQNRPGGVLDFLTPFGTFSRETFRADLQTLRSYYYENGFLDVSIGDPLVELSHDRTRLFLTIPIVEGEVYTVSDVSVTGDFEHLASQEEVMALVRMEPGQQFQVTTFQEDVRRISDLFRDMGYATANVNFYPRQDPATLRVAIEYDIDPGEIARIGRIEVRGNQLTRDRVIRREMMIMEGDQYRVSDIRRSERNIFRLGFFENVTIREVARRDAGVLDLVIEVEERQTGQFQIGAGFSSYESFVATAQIAQNNFFGRGQSLSLNASVSSIRSLFILQFFEPWLFDTRWQLTLSLFDTQELYDNFDRRSRGFRTRVGYPLNRNRDLVATVGYNLENVDVRAGGRRGRSSIRFAALEEDGLTSAIETGLSWDRRDNRLFPTSGHFQEVTFEFADSILASDNEFFRTRLRSRWFWSPIWDNWVFKLNAEYGYVGSTNRDKPVPIFERFYVGGPNSVRGFERLSLSPTRPVGLSFSPEATTFDYPVGGNQQLIFNLELEFPILEAIGIRGVVFADAGNAFDNNEPITLRLDLMEDADVSYGNLLRTGAGFGIRWRSPLGPLRFEWGFPLSRLESERPMVFEFSIANPF